MKIAIWTIIFIAAASPAVLYFYQRWRQSKAERGGVAVYATVISVEPVKRFGKTLPMVKIVLWLQEPGQERREVTLQSRVEPGQTIDPGVRVAVVIDQKNPKRVYPAGPEAAKRLVVTGSRDERRMMQSQLRSPGRRGPQAPSGYMPPDMNRRRR